MTFQDAVFNWLQIHLVSSARPEDQAAKDTVEFFEQILREDHGLTEFGIEAVDDTMVHVRCMAEDGKSKKLMFQRELAEQLLADINSNPKYN